MQLSRRTFCKGLVSTYIVKSVFAKEGLTQPKRLRKFHVSVTIDALEREPELCEVFFKSGVDEVWLGGFLYGYWYFTPEKINEWRRKIESRGIAVNVINVPLGHPGDSLGSYTGDVPLTPPPHWKLARDYLEKSYAGTSLHTPAREENINALQILDKEGFKKIFLDDDFRLARAPGQIGGCFCEEHKERFLKQYGYNLQEWEELLDCIQKRRYSKVIRNWVDFHCDELTECFKQLERSAPEVNLGIMVMYMGSEKAGIRLKDYKDKLFRVGEGMFSDDAFRPIKNKCNELFSVLFHRRFASPEKAFSETTAFPADKLSAQNMCAKLVISTIADVRNTMFMSGIRHFPKTHWEMLTGYMKKQSEYHEVIANHRLIGPFKHYWGESSRYVSVDNPYSLFLALGVPFEVTEEITQDGWTFVSDADLEFIPPNMEHQCITCRPSSRGRYIPEDLQALFALKQELLPKIRSIPHIYENKPVVCAWYPTAKKVLIWNLVEDEEQVTLCRGNKSYRLTLASLDSVLVDDLS